MGRQHLYSRRLVGCLAEIGGNRSSFKVVWIHEGGTSRK